MNRILTTQYLPWALLAIVVIVPIVAWLQTFNWQLTLTIPAIFPLLGVLAWSIMWTHYAYGWLKLNFPETFHKNQLYTNTSMWLVVGLILLHPGLLGWQQYRLFGTLPPESFFASVASNLEPFIAIGSIALFLFLTYELVHRIKHRPSIQKISGWVSLSQVLAMILIFVHGLAVGQTVLSGWMVGWWILLGVVLIPAFFSVVRHDWQTQTKAKQADT